MAALEANKRRIYFPNLDGLRTIAFLMVFISHSISKIFFEFGGFRELFIDIFKLGHLGVLLFFVLSGFLITYLAFDEYQRVTRFNVAHFYLRRVLRIWPLYFTVCLLGFVLVPGILSLLEADMPVLKSESEGALAYFPYYGLFIGNFVDVYGFEFSNDIINVLWSVSVEEQFYLLFPLLFFVFKRKWTWFAIFLLCLIAISLVFRGLNIHDNQVLKSHTLSVMAGLATGCLLAIFSFQKGALFKKAVNLKKHWIALIYACLILTTLTRSFIFEIKIFSVLELAIFSLFFAFVIFEQNYARYSIIKLKNFKWLQNNGKYTYGYYCLHMIGFFVAAYLFHLIWGFDKEQASFLGYIFIVATAFLFTILAGRLSYHKLEKPFLKLKTLKTH